MGKYLEKLIGIGSPALSLSAALFDTGTLAVADTAVKDLFEMLGRKNGFYAFESALHIFPVQSINNEIGIIQWNKPELWINEYQGMSIP